MSFIPKTWVDDQIVYAEDMNRIEQGIANAVSFTSQTLTDAQKTQARSNIGATPTYQPGVSYPADAQVVWKGNVWKNTSGQSVTGVEPGTNYKVWNVGYSNPNLLDNPWFTVNQRGQNSYTPPDAENIYCVDRFVTSEGALTVSDTGVIMDARGYLVQFLENHLVDSLQGKPVTLSVMSADGEIYSTSIASFDKNEEHKEFGAEFEISCGHWAGKPSFLIRNQDYLNQKTVRAVKLELGSVSTLANDTAPNYQQELAKCQRYYYQSWSGPVSEMTVDGACGFVAGHTATNPEAISFPVEMRTTPSIILYQPNTRNSGEIVKWSDDTSVSAFTQYCNNARCAISGSTDNLELGAAYGYHYTATADL